MLTVRPYRAGDERALVDLFQRACGRASTEQHWRWKLQQRPCRFNNAWVAEADGDVVFHYAGIPSPFNLMQEVTCAAVSVDAMTAPEYRRRGLLTQVVTRAHAEWHERALAFTLGLPNEQWGSRTRELGWQSLFPLQWLTRPLRPERMLARRLKSPALRRATAPGSAWNRWLQRRLRADSSIQTEAVRESSAAFDQLWSSCKSEWMFSSVRDRAWLQWRFLTSPSRRYELTLARRRGVPVGYSAHTITCTQNRITAILAELFCARTDHPARDTLLHGLIDALTALNAETVSTLAVPDSETFAWLRSNGFFPRQAFSVHLVPLRSDLPLDLMRDPTRWNLSAADFDVV